MIFLPRPIDIEISMPFQLPQFFKPYRSDGKVHEEPIRQSLTVAVDAEILHLFC